MEIRDLEYFAVIAEQGHLGRAAEALGLGQPAVSKCLRRLEEAVGTQLVRRSGKGVEITAAGKALQVHARRVQLVLRDIAQEVSDIGAGRVGNVRVGANQLSIDYLMPRACSLLASEAPRVKFQLTAGGSSPLVQAVLDGHLDMFVGFTPSAPDGLADVELLHDEFVVYCARSHPLASRRSLGVADVAGERWALGAANVPDWQWWHRVFADHGIAAPGIAMESSAARLRLETVAVSRLLGFAPRRLVLAARRLDLTELRVKGLSWPCRLSARYRPDAYLAPAVRRFIELLKATAKERG